MKSKTLDFFYKKVNSQQQEGSTPISDTVENLDLQTNSIQNNEQNPNSKGNKRFEAPTIEIDQFQKVPRVESCDKTNSCGLERDPGLRKQIYEYPPKEQDNIRRQYLKLKPFQPVLDNYPYSGEGARRRSFQSTWFKQFPWLEYSPSKDAAFCFPCFLFTKKPTGCFTHIGFNNWKKVNSGKDCAFLNHMGKGPNSQHNNNQKACDDLLNAKQHIEPVLLGQSEVEITNNKLRLKASIDAVRWLAFQNCPFRGHDESASSTNRGNFLELIKFIASYNTDVKKVTLENAPGNASYTSSTIQKEILQILSSKVQDEIRKEIGEAKFCVILDESQDRALREQMAIVLRFVDKNGILKERFFDLVHVRNTTSLTLQQELYRVLSYHNLNIKNIRGQGYDGASNMRGEFNGLKALILDDSPYAYYVHCFAHRLQLALVGATKEVIPIQQFFTKLGIIINMLDASSKRRDELQATQQSEIVNRIDNEGLQTGRGLNQIGNLQRAADTRWTSHLNSVNSLIKTFSATGKVLESLIHEGNSEQRASADAAYDTLMSFEFIFILHLMRSLLEMTNNLCQALQCRGQDIVNAMGLVSSTKALIQDFREFGWEKLLSQTKSFSEKHDIDIPDMTALYTAGKGRSRRSGKITMEHHYRVDLFIAATDSQIQEINNRFEDQMVDLLILSATLDPKESFKSFDVDKICDLVNKHYPEDFSEQEKLRLRCELQHFYFDVCLHMQFDKSPTLSQLCQVLVETGKSTTFPLVDRLIRLVLTLPVSTATCERAFSAMNIVKTELRSKMEDGFLRDVLVVYIEKEIAEKFSIESIIDDFASIKNRRVRFK